MAKSINLKNDIYLDSSSITHKRTTLKTMLNCRFNTFKNRNQLGIPIENSYVILPFNASDNPNDKLIIQSDGTIKIGKDVNRIVVSGACSLSVVNDYDLRRLAIFKNNEIINRTQQNHNGYQSFSLAPKCVGVKENDVISLKFTGSKSPSATVSTGQETTYLTIEIID